MAIDRPIFKDYLNWSADQLLQRYAEVMADLFHAEQEYAMFIATESRAKVDTYFTFDSSSTSHQYRDVAAKRAAIESTTSAIDADGVRKSRQHEKTFIEMVLRMKHNVNGS